MKVLRLIGFLCLLFVGAIAIFPAAVSAADQNPLTIQITAPGDSSSVTVSTVTVTGKISDPSAQTTVNDAQVNLATDGTFSTSVNLVPGSNTITVTAAASGISPVSASITVYYKTLQISAKYPKLDIAPSGTATFEVVLNLAGDPNDKPMLFDLAATAPQNWTTTITPQYPTTTNIASIQLQPGLTTETIEVNASPTYANPDPGEYPVTLAVTSADINGSIDLSAVIVPTYSFSTAAPSGGDLSTTATAGSDNPFSITASNSGSAAVTGISFSSITPQGWVVSFSPATIDNLAAGASQDVDLNIKPPSKAVAGDYLITIKAAGKEATAQDIQIRVTVETPSVWGLVGIIIVVVVIVGLIFTFRQVSRHR